MCQYSGTDGFASDWHLVHLGSRAVGQASLIIQEATAVSPEGRITYADLGIWKDEQKDKLKQIVSFLHQQGAKAGIQLAHAGRKASCEIPWRGGKQFTPDEPNGWRTFSASAAAFKESQPTPEALDQQGIDKIIEDYVLATKRAKDIGYDVIEIHAAHGYLFHQFYSPLSNSRKDRYGGSFDNRIRFLLDTVTAVKKEWGEEKPLFVRISATDWTEGGWTIDDSVQLAVRLKELGVDLIDTSSGGNVPRASIPNTPGYQKDFAAAIKKQTGILTGAVGLITTARQAEDILQANEADLILIARQSLRDPYFAMHAASDLQDDQPWPPQYERAK